MVDELDFQLLANLLKEPLASNEELGRRVRLSGTAVKTRLEGLAEEGVFGGLYGIPAPEELGRPFGAPAFSVLPRPFQAPPKGTVLSPIDWRVMRPLIREPRMPIRTLAERTGLSPKTVRRHRDALLRDGALTIEVHVR